MTGSTSSVHLHIQPCQHVATDVTTNDVVIIDIGISIITILLCMYTMYNYIGISITKYVHYV